MRDRVELQIIPSNGANVQIIKEDWVEWVRIELYYYLLGQGYDVNYERSTSPGEQWKDVVGTMRSWQWDGNKANSPPIFFTQVDSSADMYGLSRDFERDAEDWADGWYASAHPGEDVDRRRWDDNDD